MSSTLNMEHSLLMEDWQLEQSLGLTLFDDPWKTVDLVSTELKPTLADSGEESLQQLLREPTDHLADPLCEGWMESAGIAEMLQSLVQESESMEMVAPTHDLVDLSDSKASWEAASSTPEVKGHEILRSLFEQSIEVVPAVSVPEDEVVPTINLDSAELLTSSIEDAPMDLTDMDEMIHSPLSAEDVESFLSASEPSSPESSISVSDTSSTFSELKAMLLDTPSKPNGKSRTRSTPYSRKSSSKSKVKCSSDDDDLQVEFLSKKDKKKLQNKNAAIRYRQKKKIESEVVKGEENELESKNKELQDQVDQLSREIKYMKDLMAEVYKAKGVKC